MKGMVARRTRVVRARTVQHALAVAETVRAQDEANSIENNALRLRRVREDLFEGAGLSTGASFGAYRELAGRLEAAGRQLEGALYDARRRVDEKQGRSIEANREKEIAERLKDQARAALEDKIEQRLAALPRFRGPRTRQEG